MCSRWETGGPWMRQENTCDLKLGKGCDSQDLSLDCYSFFYKFKVVNVHKNIQ